MGTCVNCGNDYSGSFTIKMKEGTYEFDCFECAISALAPECEHCGTKIIGHGVQKGEDIFCCASCAKQVGIHVLRDHA